MIRYATTDGRRVTAATKTDAARIAAAMGTTLASRMAVPARRHSAVEWVAWDNLCQAEEARGTLAEIARVLCEGADTLAPMVLGARGLRRPSPLEMRDLRRAIERV